MEMSLDSNQPSPPTHSPPSESSLRHRHRSVAGCGTTGEPDLQVPRRQRLVHDADLLEPTGIVWRHGAGVARPLRNGGAAGHGDQRKFQPLAQGGVGPR